MKVVHFAKYGPHAAGIYETAHDLVLAERGIGIDAFLVDFDGKQSKSGMTDRGLEISPMSCADDADIIVRHSAIPTHLQYLKPVVFALHGRPESSFRLEKDGEIDVITGVANKARDARYKAFVTFWEEYIPVWQPIVPNISYVPAVVNLDEFQKIESPLDAVGSPNVLIADVWRDDITPFNMLFAASLAQARYLPGMELHIVGLSEDNHKPLMPYLKAFKARNLLGNLAGTISNIKDYYSIADIVITPHVIATRIIREASSMGVDIVAGLGCKYTPYQANPMDIEAFAKEIRRAWCSPEDYSPRQVAEENFAPELAGRAMLRVFESVLEEKPLERRKVFIDLGGHIGQSVRRFYREVPDAHRWDIYTFEPSPKTVEVLKQNVGFLPNVKIMNCLASNHNYEGTLYEGTVNHGDGSTELKAKLTGNLNDLGIKVNSIRFKDWLKDNVSKEDYVVVKMNIEGGEYLLMEDMGESADLVDKFLINTHSHKFPSPLKERYEAIECSFKRPNVTMAPKGEIPFAE